MFSSPAPTSFPAFTAPASSSLESAFQFNIPQQPTTPTFSFGVTGGGPFGTPINPTVTSPTFNFSTPPTPQIVQQSPVAPFTFGINSPSNGTTNNNIFTPTGITSPSVFPPFSFAPSTTAPSPSNVTGNTPNTFSTPFNFNSTSNLGTTNPLTCQGAIKGTAGISNSFCFGTVPVPTLTTAESPKSPPVTVTNPVQNDENKNDETMDHVTRIIQGIFCDEKLIGFTITPSKIEDFWAKISNFKSPSGKKLCKPNTDKDMLEVVSYISRYCWENDLSITPTSHCGFFLFDQIRDKSSSPSSANYYQTSSSSSSSKYYNSVDEDLGYFGLQGWARRRRQSNQYIFQPKILTFLDSSNHPTIPRVFSKNNKSPSNLLKETFNPSLRKDFLKLQSQRSVTAIGNLPFRLEGLFKPSTDCKKRVLQPLNYDDYLKRYSEENNQIVMESIYRNNYENESLFQNDPQVDILMEPRTAQPHQDQIDLNVIKNELVEHSLNKFQESDKSIDYESSESSSTDIELTGQSTSQILRSSMTKVMPPARENDYATGDCCQNLTSTNDTRKYSSQNKEKCCLSVRPKGRSCRINLTKKSYYCRPPLQSLDAMMDSSGHCFIEEFLIGHEDFGHVTFHGINDLVGLNLDEIIDFKLKEFNLYPDEYEDKLVLPGQGLKRPATVTLFYVWPMDKEKTHFITNPQYIESINYERTLRRSCQRMQATFVSYKPDLGHWTFKIYESIAKK